MGPANALPSHWIKSQYGLQLLPAEITGKLQPYLITCRDAPDAANRRGARKSEADQTKLHIRTHRRGIPYHDAHSAFGNILANSRNADRVAVFATPT